MINYEVALQQKCSPNRFNGPLQSNSATSVPITGLYAVLFAGHNEAGFSNFRLWEALGFSLSFGLCGSICVKTKLYLVLGNLLLSVAGIVGVEIIERKRVTKTENSSQPMEDQML